MATSAERLKQYEELFNQSQAYDPAQFQKEFEKSYGEATNYNQDLINQQSQALGELQAVAPELRQRYSQTLIKDPTLQRSLIAQARQAPITDYSNAVNLLGARGQRYSDILSQALGGYESAASRAQTAAENAWRLYQDQLAQEEARRNTQDNGLSIEDIRKLLYGEDTQQNQDNNELDINVPDTVGQKVSTWSKTPLDETYYGKLLGVQTPDWITRNPITTTLNAVGNLIANRKKDEPFLAKLLNLQKRT